MHIVTNDIGLIQGLISLGIPPTRTLETSGQYCGKLHQSHGFTLEYNFNIINDNADKIISKSNNNNNSS